MGAGASVKRPAASMNAELEKLRERELNLMEEHEKQQSVTDLKTEAYIKQLEGEKHELKQQLRDTSRALHVQREGWKKEKNKTLELTFSELPFSMLSELHSNSSKGSATLIKSFPMVTIAQCDVAGFSSLSTVLNPKELINVIDHLQTFIEDAFTHKDIFIMERTSDGCVAVSGLDEDVTVDLEDPMRATSPLSLTDSSYGSELDFPFFETSENRGKQNVDNLKFPRNKASEKPTVTNKYASHFAEIVATSALKLLSDSSKISVPLPDNKQLQLRIALHSAPCSGGVVGLQTSAVSSNIPRYKLFGTPLRYTSNLCRTGLALQIRVSKRCRDLLALCESFSFERCPDYMVLETRKPIESYWLVGKAGMTVKLPSLDSAMSLSEYEDIDDL